MSASLTQQRLGGLTGREGEELVVAKCYSYGSGCDLSLQVLDPGWWGSSLVQQGIGDKLQLVETAGPWICLAVNGN